MRVMETPAGNPYPSTLKPVDETVETNILAELTGTNPTTNNPTTSPEHTFAPVIPDSLIKHSITAQPQTPTPVTNATDAELAEYHKAFEQEFTKATTKAEVALENVKQIFIANAEDIALRLVALACGARSEMVRVKTSQYILDAIKAGAVDASSDPIQSLIDRLQGNLTKSISENSHVLMAPRDL